MDAIRLSFEVGVRLPLCPLLILRCLRYSEGRGNAKRDSKAAPVAIRVRVVNESPGPGSLSLSRGDSVPGLLRLTPPLAVITAQ